MTINTVKELNFSTTYIQAKYVKNVENYHIHNRTIVINPEETDAYLEETDAFFKRKVKGIEKHKSIIPAFSSTILNDIVVERAKSLLLLEVIKTRNIAKIIFEEGWALLGNSPDSDFPKDVPLWKSPQYTAGRISVDPFFLTRQSPHPTTQEDFTLKVNLWYAPSHTDCLIHDEHDFLEIHTQIFGQGRMQKFKDHSFNSLYEDLLMTEGYTQIVAFCQINAQGEYIYPWHQYYSETDCIWMAIEYHPVARELSSPN